MIIESSTLTLIAAAIGAALLGLAFWRWGGNPWPALGLGAGLGALGGAAGSALFMYPLNYCTFEAERERLDHWFGVGLVALGMTITLGILAWGGQRLLSGQGLLTRQASQGTFRAGWLAFPLLAPTIGILLAFLYYPSLETVRLSAHLARLGAKREAFICVDNYTRLVENSDYLDVIIRTMYISAAIVILSMALSLAIAAMAYLPIKGANLYRILLVWPYAISPAVAGIIFLLMFNPTGGIINHFSGDILGIKLGWLNDPQVAPWTIILASVWKSMGFNILFYIAALQNVPKDLIEAGSIDGANALQRFWRIVWPLLSPTTLFLLVTNLTYAFFETYATIDYLTPGGGPLQSTTTMMYQVIQLGVDNNDLGKAAAQSIVLFLMVIGMTLVLFRSSNRQVNYGA
jgi:sn-glycerol 3-phosphate transport system permease protein